MGAGKVGFSGAKKQAMNQCLSALLIMLHVAMGRGSLMCGLYNLIPAGTTGPISLRNPQQCLSILQPRVYAIQNA